MPIQKPCVYLLYDNDYKIYIGKTKNLLNRLHTHRSPSNTSSSRFLNEGFNHIVLYQNDDIVNVNNAERRTYDICKKLYGAKLINKSRPLNTARDYYIQNKQSILDRSKTYREVNKQYYKDYYINNIKAKYTCDICDCSLSKYNYEFHLKSKKHKNNLRTEHI